VIIQKEREWILQTFPLKKSQVYPVKIFLSRRMSYRNLLNNDAVSRLLKRNNFEVIEPDESFYLNQARVFSEANTIVSPGGAVLANIIFMQRGSTIVSIRSWRGSDVPLWRLLAEACEVNHSEIVGVPTYFGLKSLLRAHSNFYVPLMRIRKELSA
jgi:capsular polysaccharide biosynthesis protein